MISQQSNDPEKGAEDIFALGNPGYGFHIDRMERKSGRYERAAPQSAGHAMNQQKQQQTVEDMKQQIYQMMIAGIQAVHLNVQHVGKEGQWLPVGIKCQILELKRPAEALDAQSFQNARIFSDIQIVVQRNKRKMTHRPIGPKNRCRQDKKDPIRPPHLKQSIMASAVRRHESVATIGFQ